MRFLFETFIGIISIFLFTVITDLIGIGARHLIPFPPNFLDFTVGMFTYMFLVAIWYVGLLVCSIK